MGSNSNLEREGFKREENQRGEGVRIVVIKETSRELGAGKSPESGLFSMYVVLGLSYIGEGVADRARRAPSHMAGH